MAGPNLGWFVDDRFGLFVHWGLYSLGGRHEWLMHNEKISISDYEQYASRFEADLFDPAEWARRAKFAGMKYAVLTTKHHDGFCLWDSKLTEYTVMNTPLGKDVVREFVDAFRSAGLKVGFYHSLLDWHHPDFPIDGAHPLRDSEQAQAMNRTRDMSKYRMYLHGQIRELLTEYGSIDYLFFDFSYNIGHYDLWGGKGADDWGAREIMAMVRGLQPGIVVNDRLGVSGDFVTPEEYQPSSPMTVAGQGVPWEACQTLDGSWGYQRDRGLDKSVDLLVRMLVDGVSKNGNMLLNVGPTGRGSFSEKASRVLEEFGGWMQLHAHSIYGAGASSYAAPSDVRYTQRGSRLYVHIFAWPLEYIHLPGLAGKVEYAQLLNDASEIEMLVVDPAAVGITTSIGGQPEGTLTLRLPLVRPDVIVPVIELFLSA